MSKSQNRQTALNLVKDIAATPGALNDCSDTLVTAIAQHHPSIKSLAPVNARKEIDRLASQIRFAQSLETGSEADE